MQYSLALLTASPWPAISFGSSLDGEKARRDPRWNALVAQLAELREQGRRAIRMVDLNCGEGALLIEAAKQASRLGFLAIEGAGVDPDPDKISAARRRAGMLHDVAIGLEFEAMPPMERLAREAECPADIIFHRIPAERSQAFEHALARAGNLVLAEPQPNPESQH